MLFRFNIELSDIDRGVYQTLDLRLAQHPSETETYLLTRMFAFVLSCEEGLEYTPEGLHDPDTPAIWSKNHQGNIDLWIEIGNPSARRLHKATKVAKQVVVYTYKNPKVLLDEVKANEIFKVETIKFYALAPDFLQSLEKKIEKNNRWLILVQDGQLTVTIGEESFLAQIEKMLL